MRRYVVRRLSLIIPTLALLGTLLFFMLHIIPGDLAYSLVSSDESVGGTEQLERLREELGLNDPIFVQFGRWVWDTVRGDLGYSRYADRPVSDALRSKITTTATLAVLAVVLSLAWALPLGIASALWRGSWVDQAIRVGTAAGLAMPVFWVAILILLLLARYVHWIPPIQHVSIFEDPVNALKRMIFPALTIGFHSGSVITRMIRSTMLEVMAQDYVRTSRGKGLLPTTVIIRHMLPNAFLPILTMAGLLAASLMEGAVVVERIFGLPGLGQQLIDSVSARDFVMVQGIVMVLAALTMVWILVIDLCYAVLDPRIRYE